MIHKIYGPPGTGKTHRLINRARAYVRIGTPLHKIGYFAFTRKAANTAKDRMLEKNPQYKKCLSKLCRRNPLHCNSDNHWTTNQ